jgi:hypothetical protein
MDKKSVIKSLVCSSEPNGRIRVHIAEGVVTPIVGGKTVIKQLEYISMDREEFRDWLIDVLHWLVVERAPQDD